MPEGAAVTFTSGLSRELGPTETVKLPLVTGGAATRGTDYRIVCIEPAPAGSATCNFTNGKVSSVTFNGAHMTDHRTTGPLRLETIEDNTVEATDETVTLQLGGGATTTMTITDAPASVTVSFTNGSFSAAENAGQFQPVFSVDNAAGRDLEIPLIFTPGTATPGTDYTPVASATIKADGRSTSSFDIPIIDDNYHEGDETFRVAIDRSRLPDGVTAGSPWRTTVTIKEDDLPPRILLSQDYFELDEPQHASCMDSHVGTETTSHDNQNTGKLERVERHYGPVLTTRTYKVKLDSSPGPGKYVSVEIWEPTDLDRPDVRDGIRPDGTIDHKGRFSENARIHGISWEGGRQGRISVAKSHLTFTDKNWNKSQTVTVNIHCAQHDVNNPLPIWHFAFRHDDRVINPGSDHQYRLSDSVHGHGANRMGDNSPNNTSLRIAHVRVADRTTPAAITGNVDGKLVLDAGSGPTTGGRKMIDLEFVWNHPDNSLGNDYDDATENFAAFRVRLRTVEPAGHKVQEKIVRVDDVSGKPKTAVGWYAALEAKGHVGWVHGRPEPTDSKYEWSVVPLDRRWNEVEAERVTKCVLLTSRAGPNGGRASRIDETANPTCTPAPPPTAADGGICDRTPAVRNAIVGKIPAASYCRDVTPEHLAFVTDTLDLSYRNLGSLQAGDFAGLTSLTRLNLSDNGISTLPAGIFDDLTSLTRLELTNNGISTPPAGIFDNLTSLTRLDLNYNGISTLPAGIFDKNTALTRLYLNHNWNISTLPAGIFDKNTALVTLALNHNGISTLPEGAFDKNTALKYLYLNNNPGAPFKPTADAGPDQTVATGTEVTLSGTATGPWGDNVRFRWFQVDGPASHTTIGGVLPGGVWAATTTVTAPISPTTLHFRLATIPPGFFDPSTGSRRGIDRDYDWVTITVGAGLGSPQQDAQAAPAEASCVSPSLLADVDSRITNAGSPAGVERWTSVRAALTGQANAITLAEIRAIHERRTQHGWSTAQWDPVIEAMECLANPPVEEAQPAEEEQAPPAIPELSLSAGSAITEGSTASFTITADPAPASDLTIAWTVTGTGDYLAAPGTGARTTTLAAGATTAHESRRSMPFTVTLSEPMEWTVYVRYATRDSSPVSAVAGQDYLAYKREWRLRATFWPGQTETTIWIPIYDDSHDEDAETFEVILYDAEVYNPDDSVAIADGLAIGTITNSDPMPAAFLSRFGRTVAQQALDGIESRLAADRAPGTSATIAGQALALSAADHAGASPLDDLLARPGPTDTDPFGHHPPEPLSMTAREALLASSFTTTGETATGSLSVWGRAARDSFDGQEGSFSLDGTATTAMLGVDYARDRWLLGLALLHASGKGSYVDTDVTPRPEGQICPEGEEENIPCGEAVRAGDGKVKTSLTAFIPYASIAPSERLRLWGALGHGSGEVTLTPQTGGTLT